MTTVTPVATDIFHVKEELLKDVKLLASIDKGCSLTKVLYVPKADPDAAKVPEGHVTLVCHSYSNSHFKEVIEHLLEHMRQPEDPSTAYLNVTGAGCDMEIDMLKEKTPFKINFVEEFFAQGLGNYWLLKNVSHDQLLHPSMDIDLSQFQKIGFLKKIRETVLKEIPKVTQTTTFPCLVAFLGSGGALVMIDENGGVKMTGGTDLCGKFLLGLGNLLAGTADYNELMSLATKGDRRNTDTQVCEVFANTENSPYGAYEPDFPLFPLGKAVDHDRGLESFRKEDLAHAVVEIITGNLLNILVPAALMHGVRKIYIGGNLFRAPLMRTALLTKLEVIFAGVLELEFLKTGHTAAVGALLAPEGQKNTIF